MEIKLLQQQILTYSDTEDYVGLDMLKTRLIEAMRKRIFELETELIALTEIRAAA